MEKEHIIKALDCCTRGRKSKDDRPCFECPYNECNLVGGTGERQISGTCQGWLMKDTLSFIREQEKRIEELEKEAAFWEGETDNAIDIAEDNIRAEIASGGTSCHWCEDKIKADTVRKMQKAIKERCIKGGIYPVFVKNAIDNVASELLEKTDG